MKWFTLMVAAAAVLVLGRLFQIQVLQAAQFEAVATRLLTRPVRYVRAPRGAIVDRHGEVLVADVPANDITIHYGVLAGDPDYLRAVARDLRGRGVVAGGLSLAEIVDDLRLEVAQMWQRLAELTGHPVAEFIERSEQIRARVGRVRSAVAQRTGVAQAVREEGTFHPLLEGVSDELALAVRLELEKYPWLRVAPGSRRVGFDADPFVHLLGRVGAASRAQLEQDPLKADELRGLRPDDSCGISGVERLAEQTLRGARGRIQEDADRRQVERLEPAKGKDARLTIDAGLQRRVQEILAAAAAESLHPAGASAVVLDARTREVLVLASYPAYPYETTAAQYEALLADARNLPLTFRAVAGQYPPGSTCKAITLIGGLTEGVVQPATTFVCGGHLLPEKPNQFRCWIYNQYGGVHDAQSAEDAIRNSCNIYFFKLGEKLGAERLCAWFERFGLGRVAGTGLIEESPAIVPDSAWLARLNPPRQHQASDAWNYSIGQGEVTITPLQAANVAASIAVGYWAPPRLLLEAAREAEARGAEFDAGALAVLRRGMWRVVNEPGGTADEARLERRDIELCGKTGSAQTVPRVITRTYTLEWPDGRRAEVVAANDVEALAGQAPPLPRIAGFRAHERYPAVEADEKLPSHAWFIGFTQAAETRRGEPPRGPALAISVLIEFGSSGGRVAGPVAKRILDEALDRLSPRPQDHAALEPPLEP